MKARFRAMTVIALAVSTLGAECRQLGGPEMNAIVAGTVRRWPIMPVCQENVPCDAPFAATFEVRRDNQRVATFTSGADGVFRVRVPAGDLTIVPMPGSPVMGTQTKSVTVRAGDSVFVQLQFDTGIR